MIFAAFILDNYFVYKFLVFRTAACEIKRATYKFSWIKYENVVEELCLNREISKES